MSGQGNVAAMTDRAPVDVQTVLAEYIRKHDMPEDLVMAALAVAELVVTQRETLRMLEAAHRQLGMWTDDNKRIQRARAALANVGGTP